MSIYLSAPAIARLSACSRIAAHRKCATGAMAHYVQRGRVPLRRARWPSNAIPAANSPPEQIAMAVDGRADRL